MCVYTPLACVGEVSHSSFSLGLKPSLSGCLTTFLHWVSVCPRALCLPLEVDARQCACTHYVSTRFMYVREEYGEKYVCSQVQRGWDGRVCGRGRRRGWLEPVGRMYTAKYVQYVTYIAPVYRLFTKLIRPLSEPLIATKLRVQFFPFNGFTAIPAPSFFPPFLFPSFTGALASPDNSYRRGKSHRRN